MYKHLFCNLVLAVAASSCLGAEPKITIRLLDPRIVKNTNEIFTIAYGGKKTDVMGTRILTASESETLRELMKPDLSTNEDVPFCGHFPAYAITIKGRGTITICGLCMTWAERNKLRVLKSKKTIEFLEKLLPMPDYFQNLEKPDETIIFAENRHVPFYQLRNDPDEQRDKLEVAEP